MPPIPRLAVLTPADLEKIGRALYGEQWQTPLSRDLGMSDRSLRYLADGTRPIHPQLAAELGSLLRVRSRDLGKLADTIADKVARQLAEVGMAADVDPAPDGFQRQVLAGPRRSAKPRR
jgi:hypothetical protein